MTRRAPVAKLVEEAAAPSMVVYFAVVSIFGLDTRGMTALPVPLSRSASNTYAVRTSVGTTDLYVLRFNEGVHRVAAIHRYTAEV